MAIITTRIRDLSGAAQVDPKKIEIETYTYIYVISDVLTGLRYLDGVVGA